MLTNAERKEKMEKQNELLTRADEMVESAKTENRELTPDEMQELAEIRDDVKKIKEFLDIDDDLREIEKEKDGNVAEEEMNMNEEKRALTDEELVTVLQQKGYIVARRIVAKYREQLNIPIARLRKEL